jgi:hypothetical protein
MAGQRMNLASPFRPGISSPLPGRTRYARSAAPDVWLHAPKAGFVGAILDSIEDGRSRVLLAWPSRPDNGFVAVAVALREARATGRLAHGTLALWPWRTGSTHAARSIQVHIKDILEVARTAHADVNRRAPWVQSDLAQASLCLVELRLNDLMPRRRPTGEYATIAARGDEVSALSAESISEGAKSPTLLETTAVFAPSDWPLPAYVGDSEQILKRVRSRTTIGTIMPHLESVGGPATTPFAIMGLAPGQVSEISRCLKFSRFESHGLDAVVVDLTRTARTVLDPDWQPQLVNLLTALRDVRLPRPPPVVILCEDALTMRRAEGAFVKVPDQTAARPLRQGALLLDSGILEGPTLPDLPGLADITFEADVKDATLVPLRERLLGLMRNLREAGLVAAARAVGTGLRALSTFASLPVGIAEGKTVASILFEGDGEDEVEARSSFYPTSALQRMAAAEVDAPEFGGDIRTLLSEIRSHLDGWMERTPVSLKLSQLMSEPAWNLPDVLLVLPNARTVDVFKVSDSGVTCDCTVIDASRLADRSGSAWRRIIMVRPQWFTMRELITMAHAPDRVLLLTDAAGGSQIAAELGPLASLPVFSRFARRAAAISAALTSGGADETLDLAEAQVRYPDSPPEDLVDLTQAADGYSGDVLKFRLAGGAQVAYRPGSEVLLFTPDETRSFKKCAANKVALGDNILVLGSDVRDRLSEALARSRKTVVELKTYHEQVARYRDDLPGDKLTTKARLVLAEMRKKESSLGDHELHNVKRWLAVSPSDQPQQAQAARDRRRFALFTDAIGISTMVADVFWDFAILPSRKYSTREGYVFNKRIVHFVLDPEGIACGARSQEYDGLWQAIVDSVDEVLERSVSHG